MAVFISADRLVNAVERLAASRATQRLVDFLILKRAMRRGDSDSVRLSTKDEVFTGSIDDLMRCAPSGRDEWQGQPLINVFGTGRHGDKGYRSQKYYSNGTAVTVPRWSMMEIVSEGPRVVQLDSSYEEGLEDFLLVGSGGPKPRLVDAATWFFRFHDLEDRFGSAPTDEQLVEGFVTDLGLTDQEVLTLFEAAKDSHEPEPSATERPEAATGTVEAIRKGLAETREWASTAPFASPEERAQAANAEAQLFTADDYIEVIDRAERELERFERGEISGDELAGFREPIGQVLYYRARSAVAGVQVGSVDVSGKVGVFKGKDGERGARWEPGPRSAGIFSSQVRNLKGN